VRIGGADRRWVRTKTKKICSWSKKLALGLRKYLGPSLAPCDETAACGREVKLEWNKVCPDCTGEDSLG
jgi:hypothetical protein